MQMDPSEKKSYYEKKKFLVEKESLFTKKNFKIFFMLWVAQTVDFNFYVFELLGPRAFQKYGKWLW